MTRKKKVIFTAEQLALALGISEFTVKKLARDGELPCGYANRRPFFDMDALIRLFKKLEGGAA
jgi:hypothetical protein